MIQSQKRVLIVDDDADFLKALQLWFVKEGFEVILASNGQNAFDILRGPETVDLVLTDFMMPERNGMELVRVMKAHPERFSTPIVVMSNNTDPNYRLRAHEMGASAYLLKPEGARAVAEKAASMVASAGRTISVPQPPQTSPATVQAMRASLLALLRLTAQTVGLPIEVKNALNSAEELVESLFAAVPVA